MPFLSLFVSLLFVPSVSLADSGKIPYKITPDCVGPYTQIGNEWRGSGPFQWTARTITGMDELMNECEVDGDLAAKSIQITIDKAGLDAKAKPPTGAGKFRKIISRKTPFMKKQTMTVDVELANGKKLRWNFYVSTGNHFAEGAVARPEDETPSGSYDLAVVSRQLSYPQRIENSQAYCVAGKKYDYVGTPMPYSVFFKGGYALHSGIVSGSPESHGCVRQDPHNARKVYCLLRQKTTLQLPGKRGRTVTAENYMVTKIKICEDLGRGCDARGLPTSAARGTRRGGDDDDGADSAPSSSAM